MNAPNRFEQLNTFLADLVGPPQQNTVQLVALCGEMINGVCAIYKSEMNHKLVTKAVWNRSKTVVSESLWDSICDDLYNYNDKNKILIINNLEHYKTDELVSVACKIIYSSQVKVGIICIGYAHPVTLSKEDKWLLRFFAVTIAREQDRERMQLALQKQLKLEKFIVQLVKLFTRPSSEIFIRILHTICGFAGFDRGHLFLITSKKDINAKYEWHPEKISSNLEKFIDIWEKDQYAIRDKIKMDSLKILHPSIQEEKEILDIFNCQSLILIPISKKGVIIGFLGFESIKSLPIHQDTLRLLEKIGMAMTGFIERVYREKRFRSDEAKYRSLFYDAAEAMLVVSLSGTVFDYNRAFIELFGLERQKIKGKTFKDFFNSQDEWAQLTARIDENKIIRDYKTTLINKGVEKSSILTIQSVRSDSSVVLLISIKDLSQQQKREEELIRADKLESIGVLAGGIAHDFNNILTGILSNISLAKSYQNVDAKVLKRLIEAEQASIRAKELTHQLLTFAKGGAPVKRTASIVEILKESARFALRGSNVRCLFYIYKDIWNVEIDPGQISQVIHNLVINANQAMPKGGSIKIRTENVTLNEDSVLPLRAGRYIKIAIQDEGGGIPYSLHKKIFDPYFTTKKTGNGLGLATCFSIIKNHNGYITVESQVQKGSTFHVFLPASDKELKSDFQNDQKLVYGQGRVLVVDDEQIILDFAKDALNFLGYEAGIARDGQEAIKLFKLRSEKPFDIVIMDLTIPGGIGGVELNNLFLERHPDIVTIVSSGYSNDPVMANYQKYGFKGVLVKPYSIESLSQVLHTVSILRPSV
ncbi:response regulator [candidate division KSB1 bacterium]|nr:response regulator [candidate division KSB1 bacterium]